VRPGLSVPLPRNLSESIDLPGEKEDQFWAQELQSAAKHLRSSPRWQSYFCKTVERLGKDPQKTLEGELAMAQSEDPERFLVLLLTLTDRRYLSRKQVRLFLDTNWGQITSVAFRNALRSYRRLFLQRKSSPKRKRVLYFADAPSFGH
jgi:hypothetical protein